jgi:hypothetical protein
LTEMEFRIDSILRIRATELTNSDSWYKLTENMDFIQLNGKINAKLTRPKLDY